MINVGKPGGSSPVNPQKTGKSTRENVPNEKLKKSSAKRGRPPLAEHERKERISISLDRPTLEKLRATGPGWQTRINELLAEVVEKDKRFTTKNNDDDKPT